MKIVIAEDFAPHPIGRYRVDSDVSAQRFREEFLLPKLKEAVARNERLDIIFDGLAGCSSSFLEEAFGGLYSAEQLSIPLDELKKTMNITSTQGHYRPFIENTWEYIESAAAALSEQKVTPIPHTITDIFLRKSATDAGFDIPADTVALPGWFLCRSCRFSLSAWLRIVEQGAVIALSKQDVLDKLRQENPSIIVPGEDLPPAAAGAVLAVSTDTLHSLLARTIQLELSLPHRLAEAFNEETKGLPTQTETERLVVQRIGQDKLRAGLLEYWSGQCAVSGLALPEVLRASHIKPWRDCADARERLNVYNALLLAPHLDALFDAGFITFSDDGAIRYSSRLTPDHCCRLGLSESLCISRVDQAHLPFLEYHRKTIFKA